MIKEKIVHLNTLLKKAETVMEDIKNDLSECERLLSEHVSIEEKTKIKPREWHFVFKNHGVILDKLTGLEWKLFRSEDTTFSTVSNWINSFEGSWRLPTKEEILTIYDEEIEVGKNSHMILPEKINRTNIWINTRSNDYADYFDFKTGEFHTIREDCNINMRALLVRYSEKK